MIADIFQDLKQKTNIRKVMQFYGVNFKNRTALCCFHKEKTPSMTISESKQIFKCHGCGVGGDSITFVAKLFSCTNIEAARKINADLNLDLSLNAPSKKHSIKIQVEEAKEEIRKRKEHKQDLEFRELWFKHKDLKQYPPSEEFWDNLLKLLETKEYKYYGL